MYYKRACILHVPYAHFFGVMYTRKANFQNDNYSVGLPVFTIHGNHDDPSGVDNLSAVDVLSTCNLVNYFGKAVCFILCPDTSVFQGSSRRVVRC